MAHIAGVPVEETLLAFAPVGVAGVGLWLGQLARRARRSSWLRRAPPRTIVIRGAERRWAGHYP